jgi:hypothetical protein
VGHVPFTELKGQINPNLKVNISKLDVSCVAWKGLSINLSYVGTFVCIKIPADVLISDTHFQVC